MQYFNFRIVLRQSPTIAFVHINHVAYDGRVFFSSSRGAKSAVVAYSIAVTMKLDIVCRSINHVEGTKGILPGLDGRLVTKESAPNVRFPICHRCYVRGPSMVWPRRQTSELIGIARLRISFELYPCRQRLFS